MFNIFIDASKTLGELKPFWASTGFSPAELLLDDDMKQTLAYLGAVPRSGIQYVRIHYLLNLISVKDVRNDFPQYDWSLLDEGLDVLVTNNLKPFFELMGNPSGYFTDFENDAQLHAWKRLVRDLAQRYMECFGPEEIRSWYFETWNEPDIGFWKGSDRGFLNYYDACSEGLKEADSSLRFGGPGSAHTLSPIFKSLLAHCDKGQNYFTGETGVRLDFISVHEKGVSKSDEDLRPSSLGVCKREAAAVRYIREQHPRFSETPFMNNECDPQVGWKQIHTWRAKPYYPALLCKIVDQHVLELIDGLNCNYSLLSNDNGFMGTWGQRTHFVRFGERDLPAGQGEHETRLERTQVAFDLVKKPVFNVTTMLSFLPGQRCVVDIQEGDDSLGVIATRPSDDQFALLLYRSRDDFMRAGCDTVQLTLRHLPFEEARLVHYRLDETHANPFRVWEEMGDRGDVSVAQARAPLLPTPEQLEQLRDHQELPLAEPLQTVQVSRGEVPLAFDLPLPAVSLLLLSRKPDAPPETPCNLRAERYLGLNDQENILLVWEGLDSRVIHTYEVLWSDMLEGPYQRLNRADLINAAYLHPRTPGQTGYYKVRAVDYWGRPGEASEVLEVQK